MPPEPEPYIELPSPCDDYEVVDLSQGEGPRGSITGKVRVSWPAAEEALRPWMPLPGLIHAAEVVLAREEPLFAAQSWAPTDPGPAPQPSLPPAPDTLPQSGEFIPGEALLEFVGSEATIRATVARLHEQPGLEAYRFAIGAFATPSLFSVRFRPHGDPDRIPGPQETAQVLAELARHPALRSVGPHPRLSPIAAPDDPFYSSQWHLQQLGMEAAWAFTTGAEEVVVAVIDNGVAPHEDLWQRLLPGYDFVSDPSVAADGDGRDPDPSPASAEGLAANWHGQQVAGVIAATANNGVGIAGMDWEAKILPVRVAGEKGASVADAIAGMQWAAGLPVPGVPRNPWPADVINVSLAGRAPHSPAIQRALDEIQASGATIVAAVGNDRGDVQGIVPASYDGVIAVGASDGTGRRASYSNAGPEVDLLAPGGSASNAADWNGDGLADRIMTLSFQGRLGTSQYANYFGTSMAAPVVSGAIALLKSVRPELQPAEIGALLRETAHPFARCEEGCGAGLLNPAGLLARAGATRKEAGPALSVGSDWLHLGHGNDASVLVSNLGAEPLDWSAAVEGAGAAWVELAQETGSLGPYETAPIAVHLLRDGLPEGRHQATLTFRAGPEEAAVTLSFDSAWSPPVSAATVGAFRYEGCDLLFAGSERLDPLGDGSYELDLPAGRWFLLVVADRDGDGSLGSGDLLGAYSYVDRPSTTETPIGAEALKRDLRLYRIP